MTIFNVDAFERAKAADTLEEFMAVIESSGAKMTPNEAQKLFSAIKAEGEISDDDLDSVAGGATDAAADFENLADHNYSCPKCGKKDNLRIKHFAGHDNCTCKACGIKWIMVH